MLKNLMAQLWQAGYRDRARGPRPPLVALLDREFYRRGFCAVGRKAGKQKVKKD